jgi:hypothetical protein
MGWVNHDEGVSLPSICDIGPRGAPGFFLVLTCVDTGVVGSSYEYVQLL